MVGSDSACYGKDRRVSAWLAEPRFLGTEKLSMPLRFGGQVAPRHGFQRQRQALRAGLDR